LIVLALVPFVGIAGALELKAMSGFGSKSQESYNCKYFIILYLTCVGINCLLIVAASDVSNESISEITTVVTISKEGCFLEKYKKSIIEPHKIAVKGILWTMRMISVVDENTITENNSEPEHMVVLCV
jgi:hypothetical protein